MNIREIRSKVNEFFRSRGLPTADKLSDEAAQAVHERWVAGRTTGARSFTRGAQKQLRARNGAAAASAPVTAVTPAPVAEDNDAMREALHQQAINLLRTNAH